MIFLKLFLKIVAVAFILISIVIVIQWVRVYYCTRGVNYELLPWEQIKPDADLKVLFAGDSTAVGTGLDDNSQSISGLFSRDFPGADVENYSHNGLRLKGLADILNTLQAKKFDLAILQIGANDILDFTPMADIRKEERRVLDLTKNIAGKVIILHSGDIGQAPMLIWPFSWVYTWRSLKVREIYMASQDDRVAYVDIYSSNRGRDLSQDYARDNLHLNKQGYALWYGYIKSQLEQQHWLLGQPTIRYVALGDSYTIGTGAGPQESWPAQVIRRLKNKGVNIELTANLGHNGWTTQNLIDYELPELRKLDANFVSVLIGTNDWVQGVDAQTFQRNIKYIFSQLLTIVPNSKDILVVTVPDFSVTPAGKMYSEGRDIHQGLAEFNRIIESQAQAFDFRVVDLFPLSQTLGSLASSDGLHPSAQGYKRWADLIEGAF